MPSLSPKQKQALSGLGVVLAGAALTWANASLHLLPEGWQGLVGALLAGIAHYVPAAGTEQAVIQKDQESRRSATVPWAGNVRGSQTGDLRDYQPSAEQLQVQLDASRQGKP